MAACLLAACVSLGSPTGSLSHHTATIQRTANGIPHVSAPDLETLAYGLAFAHAQDNVCQTADQLVTVRGERSRWFGSESTAMLGRRPLSNEVIDFFIAGHMDDATLAHSAAGASSDVQALSRGYVAGYNRYIADHVGKLPAACNGKPWVRPMTLAEHLRLNEILMVQASSAALAGALVAAEPPVPTLAETAATVRTAASAPGVTLDDAAAAMRETGLLDSPLGSNAWAFGRETTANGSGLLLGNPHFPWTGVNRFYMAHLTVPGQLDVMGASIGHTGIVHIGFNKDVAWSHTVSTGKRFTLHELSLVPGDPTRYLVDGAPVKMSTRDVVISVLGKDQTVSTRKRTVWSTRWGPVIVIPRAGLTWTTQTAYALQDANAGNTRSDDAWLAINRASSVAELRLALNNQGVPWVNTVAADRHGSVMYADLSVVPDVDTALLERCAPSQAAAALRAAAGLIVLDGSKSDCGWMQDPVATVPGLIPPARMPVALRADWVHNSNDSYFHTHPAQQWGNISPMVGDARLERPRTRAGLADIADLLSLGKVTPEAVLGRMFQNRNFMAGVVLPDLLAACNGRAADSADVRDGCAALRGWSRRNDVDARGAHLFREFWRAAHAIPEVHRLPFDPAQPVATPDGLNLQDPVVATQVWEALTQAVNAVRRAGFALDATLGSVQRPLITDEPIPLHGGDEIEGVLNNLGNQGVPTITSQGLRIDYGTSYVQAVTFDARGPVAQALLTYGQSSDPLSPFATDQLRLFSQKTWPTLPFHPEDVAKARIVKAMKLTRP